MKIFVFILQTFAKIFKIVAKTIKTVAIRVNKLFTYPLLLHCCRTVFLTLDVNYIKIFDMMTNSLAICGSSPIGTVITTNLLLWKNTAWSFSLLCLFHPRFSMYYILTQGSGFPLEYPFRGSPPKGASLIGKFLNCFDRKKVDIFY